MTRGEYRPLGYAAYALLARVVAPESLPGWHIILICLHALTGLAVFALLRMLLGDWPAFGLAALYVVFPPFALLVNDINQFYILVGLLLSAISLALFVAYLRKGRAVKPRSLPGGVRRRGLHVPVRARRPRAHDGRVGFPRGVAARGRSRDGLDSAHPAGCASSRSAQGGRNRRPVSPCRRLRLRLRRLRQVHRLLATLVPFAAVAAAFLAVSATVKTPPIFLLGDERIAVVTEACFLARLLLAPMPAFAAALAMAVLAPLALLWEPAPGGRRRDIAVVFMLIVTVRVSGSYENDVTYWKSLDALAPGHPLLRFNVATALVAAGRWEEARDELLYLHYEVPGIPSAERSHWWPAEMNDADQLLVQAAALAKLGRVYHALGDDKVAGYYAFPKYLAGTPACASTASWKSATSASQQAIISWAENHYSSCLIMDPYDVRLYNALGKCLMYKNFFDAAADHFRAALALDSGNETALYHLAFITKTLGDDEGFAEYSRRWREVARAAQADIDFQPIFDAYKFDRDRMRMWFTGDPVELLKFATDKTFRDEYYSGEVAQ